MRRRCVKEALDTWRPLWDKLHDKDEVAFHCTAVRVDICDSILYDRSGYLSNIFNKLLLL